MNFKNSLALFLGFLLSGNAIAQSSVLDNYILEGIKSNLQLQQEELNYQRSVENLAIARAYFMPQVSANATYTWAHGGRKIQIPVGDLLNPVYTTLNQLTGTGAFPQIENVNTQFLPNNFHETKLQVVQQIFNPEVYFNYKAQKELISVQQAQKKAYENELKYAIISAYYLYHESEEGLQILNKTKRIIEELVKVNQSLVANDKATRDVLFSAEYELNKVEQQLAEMEKNTQVAKTYFNFLLNRSLDASIERDTMLIATVSATNTVEQLSASAIGNRQEIRQLQSGLQANEQLLGLSKGNAYMPKINVAGNVGYQGFKYKFDSQQQYWLVQFGLSWDIFKGGEKHARVQQAKIDYQLMENRLEQVKKQIELQVVQAFYERQAAQQTYLASESNVRSTEKSFQIIKSKYEEGQAILLEFLDAENKMTTARLTQSINTYELLRKEAALQKTIANL